MVRARRGDSAADPSHRIALGDPSALHRAAFAKATRRLRVIESCTPLERPRASSSRRARATSPSAASLERAFARASSRSNASDDAARALEIDRRHAMFAVTALMTLSGAAPRAKAEAIVNPQPIDEGWLRFYGEATSSSSYGGYGGNENNFDKFKYYYDVPQGWEQDTVNKVEKSTNGTDNRWKSKKNKDAKVYSITLAGYGKLKDDREAIISDLALSDYNLQDAIIGADSFVTKDRDVDGQTYVDYDLVGFYGNIFASITVYGGRLYSVFAFVPEGESVEAGRRMRDSFATINNKTEEETAADMAFYRRS